MSRTVSDAWLRQNYDCTILNQDSGATEVDLMFTDATPTHLHETPSNHPLWGE